MAGPVLVEAIIAGSFGTDMLSVTIKPDPREGWRCTVQLPTEFCNKVIEPFTNRHIATELAPATPESDPGISDVVVKFGRKVLSGIFHQLMTALSSVSLGEPRLWYRLAGDTESAPELVITYYHGNRRLEVVKVNDNPWDESTWRALEQEIEADPTLTGFCTNASSDEDGVTVGLTHDGDIAIQLIAHRISELAASLSHPS